jgi:anti-anti-sigma regulatory factor
MRRFDDHRLLEAPSRSHDFVDGTGLSILVSARLQLKDRGQEMLLRGAHGQVRRLLSTAGVD